MSQHGVTHDSGLKVPLVECGLSLDLMSDEQDYSDT